MLHWKGVWCVPLLLLCCVWKMGWFVCKKPLKLTHLSRNVSPLAVTEYLIGLLWIFSSPASWSFVRYFPTVFQDMFVLCIIFVLLRGFLQELNISAITSNLALLSNEHPSTRFSMDGRAVNIKIPFEAVKFHGADPSWLPEGIESSWKIIYTPWTPNIPNWEDGQKEPSHFLLSLLCSLF